MKKENLKVRIINKSKEGITLKTGDAKVLMSWEEFNKYWVMSEDKFWATATDELEEKMSKVNDMTTWAVIAARRVNVLESKSELTDTEVEEKLTQMLALGGYIKQLDEILGPGEGFKQVQNMYKNMFGPNGALTNPTGNIGSSRKKNREKMLYNAEQRKKEREVKEKHDFGNSSTQSLGDFFSEDAKKKLGL